jgi:hypothetical protein
MIILGHIGCVGGDALTVFGEGWKGLWKSHYFQWSYFSLHNKCEVGGHA